MGANSVVVSALRYGIPVVVDSIPFQRGIPSNKVSGEQAMWLAEKIERNVIDRSIEWCDRGDILVVNPFLVTKKKTSEKWRKVCDITLVNLRGDAPKFKYETLADIAEMLVLGHLLFSMDMMHGYDQFLVDDMGRRLFGFQFNGKFGRYRSLPMG